MLSLQGSFVPAGASGFFWLWGVERSASATPPVWRTLGHHPRVVAADALYPALRGVSPVHTVTCVVTLPSARGWTPAKVPGLGLSVANAVQWLLDLDTALAETHFRPAQSLQVWSVAAKLLLEFMARGRLLPVLQAEAGCLTADWRLAAPEPGDAARLAQVSLALPDICRAVVPPDRQHTAYQPPAASELMDTFLALATGALARQFLRGVEVPHPLPTNQTAAQHWLLGLTGVGATDLPPGLPDATALYTALAEWSTPVTAVRGVNDLVTGLRLHLPQVTLPGNGQADDIDALDLFDEPAGLESVALGQSRWEIELLLQTTGGVPQTLSADVAWAALGQDIVIGDHRYQHAEQRILADLPALIRLCPLLAPLGEQGAPSRLSLTMTEVREFLNAGAAVLQEAGFPVLLPSGLVRPDGVRARLHLKESLGEARFGLNALVSVDWDLALGGIPITVEELRHLAREKIPLLRHRNRWVLVDARTLAAALRHLETHEHALTVGTAMRLAAQVEPAGSQGQATATDALVLEAVTSSGWLAEVISRLQQPARLEPVPVPAGFHGVLRPYQQRGLDWLVFLRTYGLGACLADDMGLGKTVQVIALLLHEHAQAGPHRPALLVCPVSLVGNWRRELARFSPGLRVLVHHGTGRAMDESFVEAANKADAVITTYSLLARDEEELAAVLWAGIVADEAQNIKNPETKQAQALRRLPAEYRIALTGTPVENSLGDLWSIFSFLNPGFLGSEDEFRRTYALPIERFRDTAAAARLRRLLQPFLLRRLKTDPAIISDLPEKLEMPVYVSLTMEQAALYEAVVQDTLERVQRSEGIQRHGAVLAGLTRLKQVCNHPAHLTGDSGPLAGRSGKLDRLTEMLEEVLAEGDRALIFTQFARFGARLRDYLDERFGGPVLFLDGATPQPEREQLLDRFQAGAAPLFVLSLKAGGAGLNLTAANHVFHFDRWWNPAVEDQATDRAYRIGQTRRVLAHKLVTTGTLEERIDRLLVEKRTLSTQVIGAGEGWLGSLTTEELRDLIALERE